MMDLSIDVIRKFEVGGEGKIPMKAVARAVLFQSVHGALLSTLFRTSRSSVHLLRSILSSGMTDMATRATLLENALLNH